MTQINHLPSMLFVFLACLFNTSLHVVPFCRIKHDNIYNNFYNNVICNNLICNIYNNVNDGCYVLSNVLLI